MGSGFEGLDFAHEWVKLVVGLLKGFVYAIASAPREFLYLKINEHITEAYNDQHATKQQN